MQFPEIVVSVARKTDAALWPALFAAVGSPGRLCQGLMQADKLQARGRRLACVGRMMRCVRAACCCRLLDALRAHPGCKDERGWSARRPPDRPTDGRRPALPPLPPRNAHARAPAERGLLPGDCGAD